MIVFFVVACCLLFVVLLLTLQAAEKVDLTDLSGNRKVKENPQNPTSESNVFWCHRSWCLFFLSFINFSSWWFQPI